MPFRHLCSHLVRIRIDGAQQPAQSGNLEQIDAFEAVVATEEAVPTQVEVVLEADGLAAPAYAELCRRREADFEVVLMFRDGYRWSPELWTPDHLYAPQRSAKAAVGRH